MSSPSGRKMNYLSPSDLPNTGSMRSCDSNYSLSSTSGEVHVNVAYEYEDSGVSSSSSHDYEDLQSVRTQLKTGPRKKTNEVYESTRPVSRLERQKDERKTNYLSPSDLQNTGSIRSFASEYSLSLSSNSGDVLFNAGYHDAKTGPRKKTNDVYEPTRPLPHRVRQNTECSDDSMSSTMSSDALPVKKDTCLSKLILFLILAVSVVALALVVLIILGKMGPTAKCSCTQAESKLPAPRTGRKMSVQNLLQRISDLETNMNAMKENMENRDRAVEVFVTKYENQMESLKAQVSAQKKMINETANKVAIVDGVRVNMTNTHEAFEKKLDTEFRLLNKSVKALNKSDGKLTSAINELRQNQILASGTRRMLAVNITQLESRVQELKKSSRNMNIRAGILERRYTQMNTSIETVKVVNGAQNATHDELLSLYNSVKDLVMGVNATLNDKLKKSASSGGKAAADFTRCNHREISGTKTSAGDSAFTTADYIQPSNKRVMGMTCSTDYAMQYKLIIKSPSTGLYTCECRGESPAYKSDNPSTINCFLHVWECPISTS